MGNPPQNLSGGPVVSLDYALAAVRRRVSRVLHDDVGPSLCAAGLHLDLLTAGGAQGESLRESAEGLRAALDAALGAIHSLLAENDMQLFARGGLDGGLTVLARHGLIDWEEPPRECAWTVAQCEFCFRVVRDWATACSMTQPCQRLVVRRSAGQMRLAAPDGACSCLPWLDGWQLFSGEAGVEITCGDPGLGLELALTPVPAGTRNGA